MVVISLLLAVGSASNEGGFRRYFRLSQDIKTLKGKNAAVATENARLRREIEALRSDSKALERAAREELGWVRPGEVVFNLEAP